MRLHHPVYVDKDLISHSHVSTASHTASHRPREIVPTFELFHRNKAVFAMKLATLLLTTLIALAGATPDISLERRQGIMTDDSTNICNGCKEIVSTCQKVAKYCTGSRASRMGTKCKSYCPCKAVKANLLCQSACGMRC